jgi:hypothetical protein
MRQLASRGLAFVSMAAVVPLLAWDILPKQFPEGAHDALAASPLALIGLVCMVDTLLRRSSATELAKSCALAAAFLLWSANQMFPSHWSATLCNDLAVALFVLDVVIAIVSRPLAPPINA